MTERVKSYEHEGFVVEFIPGRCIHAAECVRGLPSVFDVSKRPWIDPAKAEASAIAEIVQRCPSGALQFRYAGGSPQEEPDAQATVEIVPAGPLYVRGDIRLSGPDGETSCESRVALCRCGASQSKPWCDNEHVEAGFDDAGALGDSTLAPVPDAGSPGIGITPTTNGPLLVEGHVIVIGSAGQQAEGGGGALCRCGASNNKPFCDGSHARIGFKSD